MLKYALKSNPKKSVKIYGRNLRVSNKSSVIVCKIISGKTLIKGKKLLQDLLDKKRSLKGKYYTNVTEQILGLLKSGETNAESKGLNTERLIINASAHKGFAYMRPRRFRMRRQKRKMTNIQIVLQER